MQTFDFFAPRADFWVAAEGRAKSLRSISSSARASAFTGHPNSISPVGRAHQPDTAPYRFARTILLLLAVGAAMLLPACGANPTGSGATTPIDNGTDNGDATPAPPSNENNNTDAQTEPATTYTLTISVTGQGTTTPPPGTVVRSAEERIALTAAPANGWQFVGWSGDVSDTCSAISILMDQDQSVTATFQPLEAGGLPRFYLPWAPGETRTIGQANNGPHTHQGRFAWDIAMSIGTPLLAVGSGRIIRAEDQYPDNPAGFPDDPETPSNAVWIDHGDGLQAVYAHLTPGGAKVVAGQLVAAGQVIGLSGNSGYSSGPHLHYEVLDVAGQSTPTGFIEVVGNNGVAEEGDVLSSQNELDTDSVEYFVDSSLPADAFAINGIELFEPTPPAFYYTTDVEYTVSGRVSGGDEYVCLSLVDPDTGATVCCQENLTQTDVNGDFDITFTIPGSLTGHFAMGVISGSGGVSGMAPVRVLVVPPSSDNRSPVAAIAEPNGYTIDFGESGVLNGTPSSDPDGDALTYQWSQSSGPPATIADPTAPTTSFTLNFGEGITRVAFQLVVFDGEDYSLPALVEYEMDDTFAVSAVGLSQAECAGLEECQAVDTRSIALGVGEMQFWLDLVNVSPGDTSSVEVLDASGVTVLTGERVHEEPAGSIFLRFSWTFTDQPGTPGSWAAVYRRNGVVETTVDFTAF